MNDKKLVIIDSENNEYSFISEECIKADFTYNESYGFNEGLLKINYYYNKKNEEFYNFYRIIKPKNIKEIKFYLKIDKENNLNEETENIEEYIELFSNISKNLPSIKDVRYNENFGNNENNLMSGLTVFFQEG